MGSKIIKITTKIAGKKRNMHKSLGNISELRMCKLIYFSMLDKFKGVFYFEMLI